MGKMSLTNCRALSTPGKFSNVDRYGDLLVHWGQIQHSHSLWLVLDQTMPLADWQTLARLYPHLGLNRQQWNTRPDWVSRLPWMNQQRHKSVSEWAVGPQIIRNGCKEVRLKRGRRKVPIRKQGNSIWYGSRTYWDCSEDRRMKHVGLSWS